MAGYIFTATVALVLTIVECQVPSKCCVPPQYSVDLTDISTINSKIFAQISAQFDYDTQKQVTLSSEYDPNTRVSNITGRTLVDFGQQVLYYIPRNDPAQCFKESYLLRPERCVPENAQYLGSTYLGPVIGQLSYDGWRFKLSTGDIVVTIAMSKEGCVPLVEGIAVPDHPEQDSTYLFTSFQDKLVRPELFNLPKSCFP